MLAGAHTRHPYSTHIGDSARGRSLSLHLIDPPIAYTYDTAAEILKYASL
jgi:hypothetical protein